MVLTPDPDTCPNALECPFSGLPRSPPWLLIYSQMALMLMDPCPGAGRISMEGGQFHCTPQSNGNFDAQSHCNLLKCLVQFPLTLIDVHLLSILCRRLAAAQFNRATSVLIKIEDGNRDSCQLQ